MSYIDTDTKIDIDRKAKKRLRPFAGCRRGMVMSVHDAKAEAERAAAYFSPDHGAGYVVQR